MMRRRLLPMMYLGIMACPSLNRIRDGFPFGEPVFYRRLCQVADRLGIKAYIFSPDSLDWSRFMVESYTYDSAAKCWRRGEHSLPHVVYDRFFSPPGQISRSYRRQIRRLHEEGIPLLARGLSGKWNVQRALIRCEALRKHLPPTAIVREPQTVRDWLERRPAVFLKPHAGTHGKGAARITRCGTAYKACGRDARNAPFERRLADDRALAEWVARFTAGRRYLIQPYLRLDDEEGAAIDVRALMQKDGRGHWRLSGMAVRRGQPGSVTSNLHGGGTALPVKPYLEARFGEPAATRILGQLRAAAERIPPVLEQYYGRQAELGIDLGVDRQGQVWIIEVNSKPGRSVFDIIADRKARLSSVELPVRYARYLAVSQDSDRPNQLRRVT
jgi:glutathione synthase/RimK-type ligase-like ATP-grasp enzyme